MKRRLLKIAFWTLAILLYALAGHARAQDPRKWKCPSCNQTVMGGQFIGTRNGRPLGLPMIRQRNCPQCGSTQPWGRPVFPIENINTWTGRGSGGLSWRGHGGGGWARSHFEQVRAWERGRSH